MDAETEDFINFKSCLRVQNKKPLPEPGKFLPTLVKLCFCEWIRILEDTVIADQGNHGWHIVTVEGLVEVDCHAYRHLKL